MMTCYSEKIMFHSQLEKKILNGIYPLLTNFTSVSREFSQTHTFSSIFVTDLVRSPVIGAIASCEKSRTENYNLLLNSMVKNVCKIFFLVPSKNQKTRETDK